jgi:hypothetical protein
MQRQGAISSRRQREDPQTTMRGAATAASDPGLGNPPGDGTVQVVDTTTGERGSLGDERERVHAKVRALLRKAESTTFPAEAEALTAKAQDLLTRHALDDALLSGSDHGSLQPVVRAVPIAAAYASGRAMLLGAVGAPNRCSVVWDPQASTAMVVGFPADVDAVELLWASLTTQAEVAIAAAGPKVDARGRSRTRSWRGAFWAAFSQRIGQRLADQSQATVAAVVAEEGSGAALPVLASRQREVDDAVRRAFPRLRSRRTSVSNGDGWVAGQQAAESASLSGPGRVLSSRGSTQATRPGRPRR